MKWKKQTATVVISQVLLLSIAALTVEIWDFYGRLLESEAELWNISFAILLPVTLVGLCLILVSLARPKQWIRLVGFAMSSGIFLHYFVISAWLLWDEFEIQPKFPLVGLFEDVGNFYYEGELRWFWLVRELSFLFLLALGVGVFLLSREEKYAERLTESGGIPCLACGELQDEINRFCTSCGNTLTNR